MLRCIIGYFMGIISTLLVIIGYTVPNETAFPCCIATAIIIFVATLLWAAKHHAKAKRKYYEKLKNSFREHA